MQQHAGEGREDETGAGDLILVSGKALESMQVATVKANPQS